MQEMRIRFSVLKRPINDLLDSCKEKLKLAMKSIINEIICSVISIFIRYKENLTYVTPCKAINDLLKITFCACWIVLSDDIIIFKSKYA